MTSLYLANETATLALGAALGRIVEPGLFLYLSGDLGSGKTTLVRGMLRTLGYVGRVKSPTYTLVEPYSISRLDFYHFDFYRLRNPDEWEEAGFREYFNAASVCVVEWPERASGLLPSPVLQLTWRPVPSGREVRLSAHSARGEQLLAALRASP